MTKPKIKHEDWDDEDFTEDDDMEDENTCECGEWKNAHRKLCDSCIFTNN